MPFNTLLLRGLIHGNSVKEKGVSVTAHPLPGEKILVFKLDAKTKKQNRITKESNIATALQLSGSICDYLFLLSQEVGKDSDGEIIYQRTLCLVELKGGNVEHATEQIINTYEHLNNMLKNDHMCQYFYKSVIWKAFICVNENSSITMTKESIDALNKAFGNKKHFRVHRDGDEEFNKVLRA